VNCEKYLADTKCGDYFNALASDSELLLAGGAQPQVREVDSTVPSRSKTSQR
jgi:hypothetical protein